MGDGKETKGASDRQVRAHIRRVLKQLLPKSGEKKKDAGDRRERLHMVARAGAISQGGRADGMNENGTHHAASSWVPLTTLF